MGEISSAAIVTYIMSTIFQGSLFIIFIAILDGKVSLKAPFGVVIKYYLYHTVTRLMVSIGSLWIVFQNTNFSETNQLTILILILLAIMLYKPIKKIVQRKIAEHKEKEFETLIRVYKRIEKENKNDLDL